MIEELFKTSIVIFGCGNVLFGDDGFGPEVISYLNRNYQLPDSVYAVDIGTSIGSYLFDLSISDSKPRCIFIVDAVSQPDRQPGEIFELALQEMPVIKAGDFSLHQFPSVNLLQEMQHHDRVKIRILAVQIKQIPDIVRPGLSPELEKVVPVACEWLLRKIGVEIKLQTGSPPCTPQSC